MTEEKKKNDGICIISGNSPEEVNLEKIAEIREITELDVIVDKMISELRDWRIGGVSVVYSQADKQTLTIRTESFTNADRFVVNYLTAIVATVVELISKRPELVDEIIQFLFHLERRST
jgi:hypothetical protein